MLFALSFLFVIADLQPPYYAIVLPKFHDFRENVLKGSEKVIFSVTIRPGWRCVGAPMGGCYALQLKFGIAARRLE
jgi:hypothetical protein